MALTDQRLHARAVMTLLLEQGAKIGYLQRRPMASRILTEQQIADTFRSPRGRLELDCSEAATLVCRLSGLASPSGPRYPYADGWGNTQTLLDYLPGYANPAAAEILALVVYGPDGDPSRQHVSIVYEPGRDPLLWSMGREADPRLIRFSVQRALHPAPARFLSVAKL